MKQIILLAIIAAATLLQQGCQAKVYNDCELAKLLHRTYGFDVDKTNNFVCVAFSESTFNTAAINQNKDESGQFTSKDYGIFQINNKYWCETPGYEGALSNDCNILCEDLLTDDIDEDVKCAEKVFKRHGYLAWNGWKAKCQTGVKDYSSCM